MAYKLVPESKRDIGAVKRTVVGSLGGALNSLQSLLTPGQTRGPLPPGVSEESLGPLRTKPASRWSSQLSRDLGLSQQEIQPQGTLEQILQNAGSQLPFLASGGGLSGGIRNAAGSIGRTILGSTAAEGAKNLGAPQWVQAAAQIGTELGASGLKFNKALARSSGQKGTSGLTGFKKQLQKEGNYRGALNIHEAQNMTSFVEDYLAKILPSTGSSQTDKIIKGASILGAGKLAGGKALIPLMGHYTHRAAQYLKVPEVRQYLGKVAQAAVKENKGDFVKYGRLLKDAVDSQKPVTKYKLVTEDSPVSLGASAGKYKFVT